jgi:cytochrome c-type biogenesis protein CcmE
MLKNKKFIIGAVIVLIAAAILGYVGFMGTGTYYYDVGEFLDKETTLAGQTIRVSGIVDQTAPPAKVGLTYHFTLLDVTNQNLKLSVVYNGTTPPDTFKPGQQAVVEGKYDTASGSFKGTSIIVKCGSKYEPA